MAAEAFDDLSDAYEAMIDWPKRLANEGPLFRRLFERVGAKAVVDVACGTGHHAAMFHAWGMRVEGADVSTAMIQRCKARFGEPAGLRWVVRGFDRPVDEGAVFDVAVCIGNSLGLAPGRESAARAVQHMLAGVRGGGAILIQVLNLWRLADGRCLWQKCKRGALPQGESVVIKGVHRSGALGYVDLIVVRLGEDGPEMRSECVPFLGLEAEELEQMAREAEATDVEFYGSYQWQEYDREQSQDLIMVAAK